jgi:hypothetical protein
MQVWPRFEPKADADRPQVRFRDVDTGSLWTAAGAWAAGNARYKGKRLTPIPVDDDVDWTVMRYWYPDLILHRDSDKPAVAAPAPALPDSPARPPRARSGGRSRRQ